MHTFGKLQWISGLEQLGHCGQALCRENVRCHLATLVTFSTFLCRRTGKTQKYKFKKIHGINRIFFI